MISFAQDEHKQPPGETEAGGAAEGGAGGEAAAATINSEGRHEGGRVAVPAAVTVTGGKASRGSASGVRGRGGKGEKREAAFTEDVEGGGGSFADIEFLPATGLFLNYSFF